MTPKPDENAVRQIFEQLEHLGLIYDSGEREDGYVAYDLRDFGELTREAQKAVLDYLDREPASHWVLGRFAIDKLGTEKAQQLLNRTYEGPL